MTALSNKATIQYMLRCPGGLHEWLMVARADKTKAWAIPLRQLDAMRTPIADVAFADPPGRHGGPGSVRAHHELLALLEASDSLEEFKARLRHWADKRVVGGAESLPPELRSGGAGPAPPMPTVRGHGMIALWLAHPSSAASFSAYLTERYSRDDILLPLSPFAGDNELLWYDHDFLEADYSEEGHDLAGRLSAFSYAASFSAAALASARHLGVSRAAALLALYDPTEPPRQPAKGLTLLGCFPYERRLIK